LLQIVAGRVGELFEIAVRLAELFFATAPIGDVIKDDGDAAKLRLVDAKRVDIVPAAQLFGLVFEALGIAGERNAAVALEPVRLVLRRNLAHPPAFCVLNSCLSFESRIDVEKAIVDGLLTVVEAYFHGAKTLVHRIEERAVLMFGLAQRFAGANSLDEVGRLAAMHLRKLRLQLIGLLRGTEADGNHGQTLAGAALHGD